MEVVSIPLSTKVSTSTLDDQIHTADKVLLNKKSSIVYQNNLSNMKSIRGTANTYPLTNGTEAAITDGGIKIGDEVWPYDNDYILKTSKSFLNKNRGTWIGGTVYKSGDNIRVINAYRKSKLIIDVYIDNIDGENITKQSYSPSQSNAVYFDISFSSTYNYYNTDYLAPIMIFSYAYPSSSDYANIAGAYRLSTDTLPADISMSGWTTITSQITTSSYGPLGPVKYSTILKANSSKYYLVYGHYDTDQRRCRAYVKTGNSYIPTTAVTQYDGFGCVSPEGTITGEPIPILASRSVTQSYTFSDMTSDFGMTIMNNGQMRWELLNEPDYSVTGLTRWANQSTVTWDNSATSLTNYRFWNPSYNTSNRVISSSSWYYTIFQRYWLMKSYGIMYAVKPLYSSSDLTFTIMKKQDYTPAKTTDEKVGYAGHTQNENEYSVYVLPYTGVEYAGTQHISPEQIGDAVEPSTSSDYDNPGGIYWFSNVQADKSKYWDFGPGWCKFINFISSPMFQLADKVSAWSTNDSQYVAPQRLYVQLANYAHKEVVMYSYGLSYPEYGTTDGERQLISTVIDKAFSVSDDFTNATIIDLTTRITATVSDSVCVYNYVDKDYDIFYNSWLPGEWRLINITDSDKPFLATLSNNYQYYWDNSTDDSVIPIRAKKQNDTYYKYTDASYGGVTKNISFFNSTDCNIVANPVIKCIIGGDISKVDGFINLIPSIVEVTPKIASSNKAWSVQYYDSLPISHSFSGTLISSGSEGRTDNWSNVIIGKSNYLLADGYLYDAYNWDRTEIELLHFDKIADNRIRINIIDGKNLLACSNDSEEFVRSFHSYNMYGMFSTSSWAGTKNCPNTTSGAANDTWYYGAAVNPMMLDGYDCSYLLPAVTVPIYVDSDDLSLFNTKVVANRAPVIQPIMNKSFEDDDTLDVFYTHALSSTDVTYKSTNVFRSYGANEYKSYGNPTFEPDKANTSWWVDSSVVIFPLALGTEAAEVNYLTPTIKLLSDYYARLYTKNGNTFLAFNESQLLNNAAYVFTIYANNYYYDGSSIYFAGSDTNVYDSAQFVCYALGMEFLGNSGTEAYFYSPFEKRIFIFTGSNTLQAEDSLSKFGNVVDHAFSSHEQILYLLNDRNQLLIRTPLDEAILDLPYSGELVTTDSGVAIVYGENGYDIPNPHDGNYTFPFSYETGFIGDSGALLNIAYVDVMLYNNDDIKSDELTIGFNVVDEMTPTMNSKKFIIKGVDWKGDNARVRLVPKNTQGNAFQVSINAVDDIKITAVQVAFNQVSTQPNTKNRG